MMSATFSSQQVQLAGDTSALLSAASNTSQEDAESDNDLVEVESVLKHPAANHAMASPGMYTSGSLTVASAAAVTPGRLFHVESPAQGLALRHSAIESAAGEVAGRASSPRATASRIIPRPDMLSRPSLSAADARPSLPHTLPSQASGSILSGSVQHSAATLLPTIASGDAAACQAGLFSNTPAEGHMLDMQQVCFFSTSRVQLSKHDQSSTSAHTVFACWLAAYISLSSSRCSTNKHHFCT